MCTVHMASHAMATVVSCATQFCC